MFHSIGPGSNGGYHSDPVYKSKPACALDLEVSSQLLIAQDEAVSEEDLEKSPEKELLKKKGEPDKNGSNEETFA